MSKKNRPSLNAKDRNALARLKSVSVEALEYVGSANYPERERHAISEVRRCFEAFLIGDYDQISFRVED